VSTASIAVLPFADLSPGHDQEYFSDGLAEEILNDLAKLPNLKVVARTSAFQFKGKNEDLRFIGQKLSVANVLEGSVRREGTRVRISAQLVKADDGFHLWSESYDRDLKDIFAVQDEIARAVTSALQLKLLAGKSQAPPPALQITNPEAYQDFLQARYFARMGDRESQQKSLDYLNRVI
jgi:TolB-like protein